MIEAMGKKNGKRMEGKGKAKGNKEVGSGRDEGDDHTRVVVMRVCDSVTE